MALVGAPVVASRWSSLVVVHGRHRRTLGDAPPMLAEQSNTLSEQELVVLRALALTAGTISVLSGLLSLYWFLRMQRTFRHQ